MSDYYDRQIKLWGQETQERLAQKRIAIIGSGGLGCSVALALSGSGIGTIHLVDFDQVELHNIHRQIAFTKEHIDSYKSEILSQTLTKRNPFVKIHAHTCDFQTFAQEAPDLDLIIDATDNLQTRSDIDHFAKANAIPWIYGSVEAFKGYVALFVEKDFSAFPIVEMEPAGIAAPMVMQVASLEANLALRYLADLKIESDLLYYLYFTQEGLFEVKRFKI